MNIRVTQKTLSKQYLRDMNTTLNNMNSISRKMTAQRKFLRASENPISAAKAIIVRRGIANLETYKSNLSTAKGILSSAETNLKSISGEITTITTKILEGVNGDKGEQERAVIATEIEAVARNMMAELNAEYAERKLFGGTNNSNKAFAYENGTVTYNGQDISTNHTFFNVGDTYYLKDASQDVTSKLIDPTQGLATPGVDLTVASNTYYLNKSDVTETAGSPPTYTITATGDDITAYMGTGQIVVTDKLVSDGGVTYYNPKEINEAFAGQKNAMGFPGSDAILIDVGLGIEYDSEGNVDPTTALDISLNGAAYTGSGRDSDGDSMNVLQLAYDAAKALREGDTQKATSLVDKLNAARATLLNGITNLGVKESSIESYLARNDTEMAGLQESQVLLEGMSVEDLAEASSQYTLIKSAYNALLQMGSSIIPSSIFDFIN